MLFICYPRCTTCQKARTWLNEKGVSYDFRDIKQDNPSKEELRHWQSVSGLPLRRFFNTSGMLYRTLNLKERLSHMSDEEQLSLLSSDGMLVKRPLVVGEDFVLVGFEQSEWEKKLYEDKEKPLSYY